MRGHDLLLLKHLDEPRTATELAEASERDLTRVSRVVRHLADHDLVTLERQGKTLVVRRRGAAAGLLVQLLQEYPDQPWGDLLSTPHLELVAFFSSPPETSAPRLLDAGRSGERPVPFVPKSTADAVAWTGYSPSHVHRLVGSLRRRSILLRRGQYHFLAPEHRTLQAFARQFHLDWALRQVQATSPQARLVWNLGRVVVFEAPEPVADGPPGGSSLAADFGLPLILAQSTHLIAPWKATASDAILQTYLQGPTRTSNLAYAGLLWTKNRPPDFDARARQYGIPEAARAIRSYAENPRKHGQPPFPEAAEYEQLARQYGVT